EERAVAEREIAGVTAQDVPGRSEHDPVEHDVKERLVKARQVQKRNDRKQEARGGDPGERPVQFQVRPGRSNSSAISNENDTIGAHDGEANAIVTASLTPTTMPAASGPSGEPSPPSITAANTTPTHAYICDGVSVNDSARHTPAMPASAPHAPASSSACARRFTPNAAAMGASSESARSARPRFV